MRRVVLAALALCAAGMPCAAQVAAAGPEAQVFAPGVISGPAADALTWPEVLRLRAARDYFTLRERLEALPAADAATPPARFARALVQHAFNAPAASNATVVALLAERQAERRAERRLADSLATALRRVQVDNDLRLFAYRAGLAAADTLLADTARLDAAALRDVRNTRRIFAALAAVPPQTADVRGPATLQLERGPVTRVPVRVNDSTRHYVFDTGANLSTIMRSEARALGLELHPAGVDVGTSTDQRVLADLAVADRLTLGSVAYRHVVFLVLDDSLLTFPGGFRIPGIVGFPVIEQLGSVETGRGGELVISGRTAGGAARGRNARNLAFDGLTPLTRVGWRDVPNGGAAAGGHAGALRGTPLVCRLDTGADRTQFYEPFYRRFRTRLDRAAPPATRRVGGAGGVRELPVRVLPRVRLSVGDTLATLDSADVLTRPIVEDPADNVLDCNVGHDVLDAFPRYVLDFRAMQFLLR